MFQRSIEAVLGLAICPFLIIAVYEGAKRLRAHGRTRHGLILLIISVSFTLMLAAIPAYVAYTMELMPTGADPKQLEQIRTIPEDWGREWPPEQRASNSRSLAAAYFVDTGLIRTVVNINGKWERYCPTEVDIKRRDEIVKMRIERRYAIYLGVQKSAGWLAVALVSFLLGWFQVFNREPKVRSS